MPAIAVACPHCRATLRSSRPVAAGRLVRCPECKTPFTVTTSLALDRSATTPAPLPPSPEPPQLEQPVAPYLAEQPASPSVLSPLFLISVVSAILVGCGLIAAAVYVVREQSPPTPPVAVHDPVDRPVRETAEEDRLAAQRKQLQEERDRLDRDRHKLEASAFLAEGKAALLHKDFPAAEKAFNGALRTGGDDADIKSSALAGLVEVRSALDASRRTADDEAKRKETLNKLLTQARKDLADKQVAAAVVGFQSALTLAPDDEGVRKELLAARAAADADQAEKKKLAEYQDHLNAGRAHLAAQRFPDALREFLAASRVMPGDPQALQGQRVAEAALKAMAAAAPAQAPPNGAFQDKLDQSRRALTARRYQEAIDAADAAVRLLPDDPAGKTQLQTARDGQRQALALFQPLMQQANAALALGRPNDAFKLFTDASRIMPEDADAQRGMDQSRAAADALQLGRVAYLRLMDQGRAALVDRRFADAVTAFTEALSLAPGDPDASRGLRDANAGLVRRVERRVDVDQSLQLGKSAMTGRRFADAVKYFTQAQSLDPDNPRIAALLLDARYNQYLDAGSKATFANQRTEAIRAYQAALQLKPNDPVAQNGLRNAQAMRK